MAASKYSIPMASTSAALDAMEAALNAKGLITSTLYKSASYFIFSTPLTSKVIRLYIGSGFITFNYQYGDSWTSGSSVNNPITLGVINYGTATAASAIDVIADTDYFAIIWQTGTGSYYGIAYLGALTNGDELAFGMTSSTQSVDYSSCQGRNITDGITIYPVSFGGQGFKDASDHLYTMPLMWSSSTYFAEMNGSEPAGTLGVKVSSATNVGGGTIATGSGYILMPSKLYYAGPLNISSSLLLEYTA